MASQHLTHCTVYPRLAARADSPWNKEPLGHYGTLCACARRRWHLHRCDAYAPGVGTALDREDTLDTSRSVAGVFSWDSENIVPGRGGAGGSASRLAWFNGGDEYHPRRQGR